MELSTSFIRFRLPLTPCDRAVEVFGSSVNLGTHSSNGSTTMSTIARARKSSVGLAEGANLWRCLVRSAVVLIVGVSLLLPSESSGQGVATAATVGVVLSGLLDQVGGLIDQAKNAGNSLQMEAGREVYLALQNAQNAYAQSLNLTVSTAGGEVTKQIGQLTSLVNDVQNNTFGSLTQLTTRTQTIVNSLPFRQHQPQVERITPTFIAPRLAAQSVPVRYEGNFEFASDPSFAPILKLHAKQIPLGTNTTQKLTFELPRNELGIGNNPAVDSVHFVHGTLEIPWNESIWMGLRHRRHQDTYKTLIGVLPSSPGAISVMHFVPREVIETRAFNSTTFELCSIRECGNNDHLDVPFAVAPDAGWSVVRNTSHFDKSWNEGDNSNSFVSDDGGQVVYKVSTVHHGAFGTSGKVRFSIGFNESRAHTVTDTVTEVINDSGRTTLHWGEQRTYPFATGTYKVVFDAFDKAHFEFQAPDNGNPFLKVRDQGGSLVLVSADPATLIWP
jgi:hypothetical protein